MLDEVGSDLLAFGPDTGHMSWAGMDVAARAVRLLDAHRRRAPQGHLRRRHRSAPRPRTWTTTTRPGPAGSGPNPAPGRSTWPRASRPFPADYTGDYMIEVDVPSVPIRECHQIAYDWALAHLPLRASAPVRPGVTVRAAAGRGGRAAATSPPCTWTRSPANSRTPTGRGVRPRTRTVGRGPRRSSAAGAHTTWPPCSSDRRARTSCTSARRTTCTHRWPSQCLRADVHVLLEKPVATTRGRRARRWSRRRPSDGQLIGVCFQNRYNATSRASARARLDGDALGRVLGGRAQRDLVPRRVLLRRRPWRGTWAAGRRRGAHQPGHPHPGPAAVVPRRRGGRPRPRRSARACPTRSRSRTRR